MPPSKSEPGHSRVFMLSRRKHGHHAKRGRLCANPSHAVNKYFPAIVTLSTVFAASTVSRRDSKKVELTFAEFAGTRRLNTSSADRLGGRAHATSSALSFRWHPSLRLPSRLNSEPRSPLFGDQLRHPEREVAMSYICSCHPRRSPERITPTGSNPLRRSPLA